MSVMSEILSEDRTQDSEVNGGELSERFTKGVGAIPAREPVVVQFFGSQFGYKCIIMQWFILKLSILNGAAVSTHACMVPKLP